MTSIDTPAAETRERRIELAIWAMKMHDSGIAYPSVIHACADAIVAYGWRPPASVIPADTRPYETQTQALDALPVHTLVSYRDHDGELHTLEKDANFAGHILWFKPGERRGDDTYNLVRNEVDYTIVRMGDGS